MANICIKQNKGALISPNSFLSARIIIALCSNSVLRPLKTFRVGFRFPTTQASYLKAGSYYLIRSLGYLRNQSRFGTIYIIYQHTSGLVAGGQEGSFRTLQMALHAQGTPKKNTEYRMLHDIQVLNVIIINSDSQ